MKRKVRLRGAGATSITQGAGSRQGGREALCEVDTATAQTGSPAFPRLPPPLPSVSWGLFISTVAEPPRAGWLPHIVTVTSTCHVQAWTHTCSKGQRGKVRLGLCPKELTA